MRTFADKTITVALLSLAASCSGSQPPSHVPRSMDNSDLSTNSAKLFGPSPTSGIVSPGLVGRYCDPKGYDIHCYADRCAWQLAGNNKENWRGNYMPEDAGPDHPDVKLIKPTWNGYVIDYAKLAVNGINGNKPFWQYTFDGKPAGSGHPESGIGAPIVAENDPRIGIDATLLKELIDQRTVLGKKALKCEWVSGVVPDSACDPGQKWLKLKKNDTTWTFIFRRVSPPNPEVTDLTNPFFSHHFPIIDVNAYKVTETSYQPPNQPPNQQYPKSPLNATCWFDTLVKSGTVDSSGKPTFPHLTVMQKNQWKIPVPGGKWGTSPEEITKKNLATEFFDAPQTVARGGCVECHGAGPEFNSPFLHQRDENEEIKDQAIAYFSTSSLHPNLEYFETADTDVFSACSQCHGVWSRGSARFNIARFVKDYTTPHGPARTPGVFTNWRKGLEAGDDPNSSSTPNIAPLSQFYAMPPDQPADQSDVHTIYNKDFLPAVKALLDCIDPTTVSTKPCQAPSMTSRSPLYYGEHEPKPKEDNYNQKIMGPAPAENMKVQLELETCKSNDVCNVNVEWKDTTINRWAAAKDYIANFVQTLPVASQPDDGSGTYPSKEPTKFENPEYCLTGSKIPFTKSYLGDSKYGWQYSFKGSFEIPCGQKALVRVCGFFADNLDNPANPDQDSLEGYSIEKGLLMEIQGKACTSTTGGGG